MEHREFEDGEKVLIMLQALRFPKKTPTKAWVSFLSHFSF